MKLYDHLDVLHGGLPAGARPSVTLHSGLSGVRHRPLAYVREMVKLNLRALAYPGATRRWLQLLNSHPAFAEMADACPRLLYKIYRPYLTNTLDMDGRVAVLASHYQFMFRRGLAQTMAQAARGPLALAAIEGKSGVRFDLALRAIGVAEREGELVLQLNCAGHLVYSVAFSFSDHDGAPAARVGCLQGPKHGDKLALVREATRELHGMRPKQLMVTLVRALGAALGCTELRLVGNANRTARSALEGGRLLADYDQTWREIGATEQADGDFAMPCAPLAAPDMDAIASKKRSEARKRHELVAALAEQLVMRFTLR
jgi:uncharacterized protein VirK/YbjX